MKGEFQVKDDHLLQYFHKVIALLKYLKTVEIKHISREENAWVDRLSKLSTRKENGQLSTII